MRPKLPEIWFKKILVLPPSNLISGHRQLTRNPLICRWQNICLHTFAPRLYNVSNRLKSFLVNGDENQPKNVHNATKRHFWGGENELAGKRRDGLRHFLDDQHPTVPSCPSWGMVGSRVRSSTHGVCEGAGNLFMAHWTGRQSQHLLNHQP